MALIERSAGVIIFRGTPAEPQFLLLDYGRYWDFAKGHVEAGESDRQAALRETREETGLTVTLLDGFCHEITYFFRHKSKGLIKKTVAFFIGRAELSSETLDPVVVSHEHVGHAWLTFDDAMKQAKYASAKEILRLAHAHLSAL